MDVPTLEAGAQMPMRALIKSIVAGCCVLAAGCASNKDALIPQDGPPMADIYKRHMAGLDAGSSRLVRDRLPLRPPGESAPAAFVRTAANEIDNRFGRVPNPDLVMFVFPHLAGNGQYPVPAYTTVFPMYDTVHYAMPGEIAPRETMTPARQASAGVSAAVKPGSEIPHVKTPTPPRRVSGAIVPVSRNAAMRADNGQ